MRTLVRFVVPLAVLCLAGPAAAAGVEVPNPLGDAQGSLPQGTRGTPPRAAPREARPAAPSAAPGAAFPAAVDPRYAGEPAGKARMHTCLDRYRLNGASGNGGLRWIERGGGYWSECNKRLKG